MHLSREGGEARASCIIARGFHFILHNSSFILASLACLDTFGEPGASKPEKHGERAVPQEDKKPPKRDHQP